jgi:hypothetical protein
LLLLLKDCVDPGDRVDLLLFRPTKGGTDNWIIEHRLQVPGILGFQGRSSGDRSP